MDCLHKQTKTISIFVTTHVLPRKEINRRANTYQNFLNKDRRPKSKSRHKVKGRYALSYYRDKMIDNEVNSKNKRSHSFCQPDYRDFSNLKSQKSRPKNPKKTIIFEIAFIIHF